MKILLIITFLIPSFAYADQPVMLFVDLNYSSQELAAAQRIAKERGELLYVLPPLSHFDLPEKQATPLREKIEVMIKQIAPKESEANQEWALWGAGTDGTEMAMSYLKKISGTPAQVAQLRALMDQYKPIYDKIVAMENASGTTKDQIVSLEKIIKSRNQHVDTLIISGHSDGSRLEGETSIRLEDEDLIALTKETPELFNNSRNVLLLGCYSNTPMAHERWRGQHYFTNASLIAGYGGRAPLRTNPLSPGYIYDTLHTADELDKKLSTGNSAVTAEYIRKQLALAAKPPNSALDYCGIYIDKAPSKSNAGCDEQWMVFDVQNTQLKQIYVNTPTKDPPRDPDDPKGLRPFYNSLQGLCPAKLLENSDLSKNQYHLKQATEETIRLIYWWKLQARYASTFKPQIDRLTLLMKQNGISAPIPKIDGNLSRVAFVPMYKQLFAAISAKRAANFLNPVATRNIDQVFVALDEAFGPLYHLDERIPLGWL